MDWKNGLRQQGVPAALGAALLFGSGTPLSKLLLQSIDPWMLAGLLYIGSGVGLTAWRVLKKADKVTLAQGELPWLLGAILAGGIIAPVLLMLGLSGMPASGASLLLNAEVVFTALLAWFAFKENFDKKIAAGMVATLAGALILSWPGKVEFSGLWPALAVLAACLSWGIDNNLTRKVSLNDATWIASVKGLVAGSVNLVLAVTAGAAFPSVPTSFTAMVVGFFAYGVSLALFVLALRHLGTARTGAYFSVAPFFGAVLALALGDPITFPLVAAGSFMAFGIWCHITESHEHEHKHFHEEHSHEHSHDDGHHDHVHDGSVDGKHSHSHIHEAKSHSHPHFPDAHHQHAH